MIASSRDVGIVILAVVLHLVGCADHKSPADVVSGLYAAYIAHPVVGVPDSAEMQRLRPFLSRRLSERFEAAAAYRVDFIKRHPDEPPINGMPRRSYKPPFADGSFFTSLFEGATAYEVVQTRQVHSNRWEVTVRFWYGSNGQPWEDIAVVVKERGRFVVDDVVFSGAGPFNPPGNLLQALDTRRLRE